jgi:hypothetical protein
MEKFMDQSFARRLTAVGALIGIFAAGGTAQAATVSATASVTGVTATLLELSNDQYLSDASTPDQSGFDASSVLQSYSFSTTHPNGDTSVATIDNLFAPMPQTSAQAINNGLGSATVQWSFDWTATETGIASLDVEYLYTALVANLDAGDSAVASSFIKVQLDGTSVGNEALYYFNATNGFTSGITNMLLQFAVVAGEHGSFTLTAASNAFAAAPVPLPAGLPLLVSGLLGLGGLARRRLINA